MLGRDTVKYDLWDDCLHGRQFNKIIRNLNADRVHGDEKLSLPFNTLFYKVRWLKSN